MTDLSEFEKGMIVGMRSAGCSVTETAIYLRRARSTVSAVMTAYKKCGNVTSGKHSSGWKRKLTDRTPKEAFAPECVVPTVKHGGGSLMVWGAIYWRGVGPLVTLHGKVKAAHYVNILGDQVHPFVQTLFPGECPLYQDDNAPIHTAKIAQEWFVEHEGKIIINQKKVKGYGGDSDLDIHLFCAPLPRGYASASGYSQCQSDRSINRPSIWYTRYGDVVDFSREGLLSQEPMELGRIVRQSEIIECVIQALPGGDLKSRFGRFRGTSSSAFLLLFRTLAKEVVGVAAPHGSRERNCDDLSKTESLWAVAPMIDRG
ncbi:transposable element Tcb1 transposase [Trichonephila clavipes]|nr:transposable element Tcb1 transposase [Trichonephila clavipes]